MKLLYVTDLHGDEWKYDRQGEFITGYLSDNFSELDKAGVYYLSFLGNDGLRIFDK